MSDRVKSTVKGFPTRIEATFPRPKTKRQHRGAVLSAGAGDSAVFADAADDADAAARSALRRALLFGVAVGELRFGSERPTLDAVDLVGVDRLTGAGQAERVIVSPRRYDDETEQCRLSSE